MRALDVSGINMKLPQAHAAELVTTIIPVHNRASLLREAVTSVLAQSYQSLEVIIVDDGSTDDTAHAARELAEAHPGLVHVLWQANAGPGAARNLGLQHARGEFIQYLDSDDLLEPRKFEWQVAALRAHPHAGLAYGITRRVNMDTGESRMWARTAEPISAMFPDFLMQRGWDTNSPLWRRSACELIGSWLPLRCTEDWEHDLRAGMLGVQPVQVSEHVAIVRDHGNARASGMSNGFTPELVHDMFHAHAAVWKQMCDHGMLDWSYLQSFASKTFWIARMCGERGLFAEADAALTMATEMVASHHPPTTLRLFAATVRVLGWSRAVRWSEGARALVKS